MMGGPLWMHSCAGGGATPSLMMGLRPHGRCWSRCRPVAAVSCVVIRMLSIGRAGAKHVLVLTSRCAGEIQRTCGGSMLSRVGSEERVRPSWLRSA